MRFCKSSTIGLGFENASSLVGASEAAAGSTAQSFSSTPLRSFSPDVIELASGRVIDVSTGDSGVLEGWLGLRLLFCDLGGVAGRTLTPGMMREAGVASTMIGYCEYERKDESLQRQTRLLSANSNKIQVPTILCFHLPPLGGLDTPRS